jgi:peptidoglycan hydrolase CwlO-like protein
MYNPVSKFQLSNIYKYSYTKLSNFFAVFLFAVLVIGNPAFAALTPQQQAEYDQIQGEISSINSNISALKSQKSTLANELAILDGQAQSIQLQIAASQAQISLLVPQIDETNTQIQTAEVDMQKQKALLGEYVRQMYIDGQTSQMQLILTSNNFSDFVDKSQYLNTMQGKVKESTDKIIALKNELEAKKVDLETKKATADSLRASQQTQKNALDIQASQKSSLIAQTNGSEAAYQKTLNGKINRKGILDCIAAGGCKGDVNGQIRVVNTPLHYYQWDNRWGSTEYDPGSTFANVGCLITSLAMYHGVTPPQEASNHSFSDGYMMGATGRTISKDTDTIQTYLARGQKVILKLNMGTYGHFVLAVGIDNGQILINDPYNGEGTTYNTNRILYAEIPY